MGAANGKRRTWAGLGIVLSLLFLLCPAPVPRPAGAQQPAPAAAAGPQGFDWRIEAVVGAGPPAAPHLSLAADALGRPHLAYAAQDEAGLYYLHYDGLSWQIEQVDGEGTGSYNALALDAQGRPHLGYRDSFGYAHYAYHDGSTWHDETVDSNCRLGAPTALALDAAGRPHLAYYDDTFGRQRLRYAHHDGSAWQLETVQDGSYTHPALVLDQAGRPHLVYYDEAQGNLLYAFHDSAAWQFETVESIGTVGRYPSLRLDDLGRPHLSYYIGYPDYALRYATHDGTTWQIQTVDGEGDVGAFSTLALDGHGQAHIAYYDLEQQAIQYAGQEGAHWQTQTIEELGQAYSGPLRILGLFLDRADEPCLAYVEPAGGLRYACRRGNDWLRQQPNPIGDLGAYADAALDAAGRPHLSYSDGPHQALLYAYHDGASWRIETVDPDQAGQSNALALDAAGRPHLAYYDVSNGDLRYAYHDGTGWQSETVDSSGDVGLHPALALDAADQPHLCYTDQSIPAIRYAHKQDGAWQIDIVESGDLGASCALALDPLTGSGQGAAGRPHLCYSMGSANAALKVASHDGTGWQSEIVESNLGAGGGRSALALDADGRLHIGYYNVQTGELRYARREAAGPAQAPGWQVETVDGELGYGGTVSLELNAAGQPFLSYFDGDDGRLKLARYDGSTWRVQQVDDTGGSGTKLRAALALDGAGRPHLAYYDALAGAMRYARPLGAPVGEWSRLVFGSYRDSSWGEIYGADGDGGNPVRLTFNDAIDREPALNHGASRVVFASSRDWNSEIYAMNADGSGQLRLTQANAPDGGPAYSPDGSRIAFHSRRDGDYEIWVMNGDGSGAVQLTFNQAAEGYKAWDGYPTWSPDGSRLAFISDRGGTDSLWVMNTDGSGQSELWPGLEDAGYPAWSPDGSRIALSCRGNGDYWDDLAVVSADGSSPQYPAGYTPFGFERLQPAWAPDGSGLAFSEIEYNEAGGNWSPVAYRIYHLDLQWGAIAPLLSDSGQDRDPHWAATDNQPPICQVQALPGWSAPVLAVSWGGWDEGPAGPRSYDVQYRQGENGPWIDWLLDTEQAAAAFAGAGDFIYAFRCRAHDRAYNSGGYSGEVSTHIDALPPLSAASAPTYAGITFTVQWAGSDAESGMAGYDLQYRDGSSGPWTDWLTGTGQTAATFAGLDGHRYCFRSRAYDGVGNLERWPAGDGDGQTLVDVSPPSSAADSPPQSDYPCFVVAWSGDDGGGGSGVASFDLQVKDGASGAWTDWLLGTTGSSAVFCGQVGGRYAFQSRARDYAGNTEDYPGGDGDCQTQAPQYVLAGSVLDHRERPVVLATLQAAPPVLNPARSGAGGEYALYYNLTGSTTLTVSHGAFAALPPVHNVPLSGDSTGPTLYLTPPDERVEDGGFENGDLSAWRDLGQRRPVLTATAHSGRQGVHLGGVVPPPLVTPTAPVSASAVLSQAGGLLALPCATLTVPLDALSGTTRLTLSGVPTVSGLPGGAQDSGLHLRWQAALGDGAPLSSTRRPLGLSVRYQDAAWQDAQIAGEESLALWQYDAEAGTWTALEGLQDCQANTIAAAVEHPGLLALLGAPHSGPWQSGLEQELLLEPLPASGTLSLLYQLAGPLAASDTLQMALVGSIESWSHTVELAGEGWTHTWWALPDGLGPTATLRLRWSQGEREAAGVVLDEISLGPARMADHRLYLPLVVGGWGK